MPPQCPVTNERAPGPQLFSPAGWAALRWIEAPYCVRCGAPFQADYGEGMECARCIARPPAFDSARAAFVHEGAGRKLVSKLKFSDRTDIAYTLAKAMARAGEALIEKDTLIAPIPLHWTRLAARRFNQSTLLAREVARLSGARLVQQLIYRTKPTPPQRAQKMKARPGNVKGVFAVKGKSGALVKGARVVLIDDVLTSGATLSEASKTLKKAGAARVDGLVLTRVVIERAGAI